MVVCLAAALVLTGCGGGDVDPPADVALGDTPAATTSATPTATPTATRVTPVRKSATPSSVPTPKAMSVGPVRLVYASSTGLWSVGLDGSKPRRLSKQTSFGDLAVSPDGRRIAWLDKGLWVADIDASGRKRIDAKAVGDPTFSPDSRSVAMTRESGEGIDAYVINVDGTGLRRVTTSTFHYLIAFHPDGRHVLAGQGRSVDLVPVAGGEPERLFTSRAVIFGAAVSPKGSLLCRLEVTDPEFPFASRGDLFLIGSDGTQRRVTRDRDVTDASWSPEGARIVFDRSEYHDPRHSGIWTMDADGTNLRQLSDQGSLARFSSDGRQIAYTDGSDLYLMRADGSGARRISTGTVEEYTFTRAPR